MPKKPKTASARLLKFQEMMSKPNPFRVALDWSDPTVWAEGARNALDLNIKIGDADEFIRRAFAKFNLDPRNPYDWRDLLGFYARAHVRRGAPDKWTPQTLCALLRHISSARQQYPHLKNREEIYRTLVKRGAAYTGRKTSYLKHGHKRALDPQANEILRYHRDAFIDEWIGVNQLSDEDKGITWARSAIPSEIKELALGHALTKIGAPESQWKK